MNHKSCLTYDYITTKLPKRISVEKYQEYLIKQYIKQLNAITNLSQLKTKSLEEICPVLNYLISKHIYYINAGKVLLSINPGLSDTTNDAYFNLKEWYESISLLPFNKWSPHIYSTAHSCYAQMIEDNKDQAIVLTGSLGSGKSYNANKLIQYLFFISSPSNFDKETYEVINKGMKLMNIINSIYQKHNLNSSSSGVVYHIGFTPSNEIAFFDLDSEILDCTLPFSENGRSFTLLHGFALTHLESPKFKNRKYNFFKKYRSSFPKDIIESFNKKDIETWDIFQKNCQTFLSEEEFQEVKIALEMIILINEITLTKTKIFVNNAKEEVYLICKSKVTQRMASLLNMTEQKLIDVLQSNSLINQQKTLLVSIMKYSYCCIHDFVLKKIKLKLSLILDNKGTKYIRIIDFPGQVNQQTLGGMTLNVSNECLNLYSMSNYTSILSQIEEQKIKFKSFKAPLSFNIIKAIIGDRGIMKTLSKDCNSMNQLSSLILDNDIIPSILKLNTKNSTITIDYAYTSVAYNYNDLHKETHTLIVYPAILKLLMNSKIGLFSINQMSSDTPISIPIHEYVTNKLRYLFCGLENVEPFVVHCIHSTNSYLNYFNQTPAKMINNAKDEEIFITRSLLFNNINQSAIVPVLHWEWNGYGDWIELKTFADDFSKSYEMIIEFIKSKKESQLSSQEKANITNSKHLSNEELCRNVISLFSLENDCLIGTKYILMKKNGYRNLKKLFSNLLSSILKTNKPNLKKKISKGVYKCKETKDNFQQKNFMLSPDNNQHYIDQSNQMNKVINLTIIDQSGADNINNDLWLDNKYNIDNIFQNKQFSELKENHEEDSQIETRQVLFYANQNNKQHSIDNNVFLPFVIFIQKKFRGYLIRNKFTTMYRYIKHNIIIIQSLFRGYIIRIKFSKFIECLKHIILIQICYKVRYDKKTEACIKLQRQWRSHLKLIKSKRPLKKNNNQPDKKIIISISPSVSVSKAKVIKSIPLNKTTSKRLAKELEQETDKDKIIYSILHNSFLLNETKYSHYGLYKSIQNYNRKSSQFIYASDDRLEDRLIQYGRNLQLRQLKTVSKQMELDHEQYTFQPQINENTKKINKSITKSFHERCEDYEKKKRNNLEKIKERIPNEVKTNCTFKPQINDIGLKRDFNDLLLWKEKVTKEKEEYRKHYKEHNNKDNELDCQVINSMSDKIDYSDDYGNILKKHLKKYKRKKKKNYQPNNNDNYNEERGEEEGEEEREVCKEADSSSMRDVWPIELQKDFLLDSY